MVKVGIIGCGKIAQVRHIPEYLDNPNAKLTGLYDLNLQRAKELAEKTGILTGILNRYLNQNDEYSPSLEILPTLCIALENDILIQ